MEEKENEECSFFSTAAALLFNNGSIGRCYESLH